MGKSSSERLRVLSVKLPGRLSARVAKLAKARGTTVSEVVRGALEQLDLDVPAPRKGSALARAGKLAGSFDGPGDLSTNPAWMDGYGR